jgi:hypothetical protein
MSLSLAHTEAALRTPRASAEELGPVGRLIDALRAPASRSTGVERSEVLAQVIRERKDEGIAPGASGHRETVECREHARARRVRTDGRAVRVFSAPPLSREWGTARPVRRERRCREQWTPPRLEGSQGSLS